MRDLAWTRAADVAARQHGVITRSQCHALGLDDTRLSRATKPGGRWQRVLPGIYCVFTGPLTSLQLMTAALFFGGPSAQLTGVTALVLYGCVYVPDDSRVHLLVASGVRRATRPGIRLHRTGHLPPARLRRGMPVSPADRAAIVAARGLRDLREVRAMLSEVVQRRLTTLDALDAALEDGYSSGGALPRRVLAELAAGVRSAPEIEFRDLLARRPDLFAGVRWNYRIALAGTVVVADACWPQARVIVEIDSIAHHGLGDGPEYTARRRAALVAAGWTVLSISPRRLRTEPDAVLAELAAVLHRATTPR